MKKSTHTKQYRVFLNWLIQARKEAGFTQQEVADKLGRPQSFVAKYENGERRLDLIETVEIAQLLTADLNSFLNTVSDLTRSY